MRIALVCVLFTSLAVVAHSAPGDTVDNGRVFTVAETAYGGFISRDAGFSRKTDESPARTLWAFGDTGVWALAFDAAGNLTYREIAQSFRGTAAIGSIANKGAGPVPLVDIPALGAEFLPPMPPGFPTCPPGTSQVQWINGLSPVRSATHSIIVFFTTGCFESGFITKPIAWGGAEYRPSDGVWLSGISPQVFRGTVTSPVAPLPSHPVLFNGYYYFLAIPAESEASGWLMARVKTGQWADPAAYSWWGAAGWGNAASAAPIPVPGGDLSMDKYPSLPGAPFVILSQSAEVIPGPPLVVDSTTFRVFATSNPADPTTWTERFPSRMLRMPRPAGLYYGLIGHPEQSTAKKVVISYDDPGDSEPTAIGGHVRSFSLEW